MGWTTAPIRTTPARMTTTQMEAAMNVIHLLWRHPSLPWSDEGLLCLGSPEDVRQMKGRAISLTSVSTFLVLAVGSAIAAPAIFGELARVSGRSPFPEDCGAHSLDPTGGDIEAATPQIDSEVEPHIAVDPTDPDTMISAWIQDRHPSGGGGRSNVVGVSKDGGRSWKQVVVPGISGCTGGRYARATDPWLDFGPDEHLQRQAGRDRTPDDPGSGVRRVGETRPIPRRWCSEHGDVVLDERPREELVNPDPVVRRRCLRSAGRERDPRPPGWHPSARFLTQQLSAMEARLL